MINIIIQLLNDKCSNVNVFDYAIAIEHNFYETFNHIERKYLDYLDLKDFVEWHIEQCERC